MSSTGRGPRSRRCQDPLLLVRLLGRLGLLGRRLLPSWPWMRHRHQLFLLHRRGWGPYSAVPPARDRAEGAACRGGRELHGRRRAWSSRALGGSGHELHGGRWPRAPVEDEEVGGGGELHALAEEAEEAWAERKRERE